MSDSSGETGDPDQSNDGPTRDDRLTPAEFAALFETSYRRLWLIAAGITGNRDHAEDLVQDAALTALGKLDTFEPGTSFVAWMARIVRLKSLNSARTVAKRGTRATDPATLDQHYASSEMPALGPPDAAQLTDLGNLGSLLGDDLTRALSTLAEVPRTCLLLRIVLDMTYGEISEAMAIPAGTAMSHVHRCRQALRRQLTTESSPQDRVPG